MAFTRIKITFNLSSRLGWFNHSSIIHALRMYWIFLSVINKCASQGNQLFISYILAEIPTVLRRMHLLNHFGFVCECENCAATCDANVVRLKSDPCFQFLWRNPKPNLMVDHTRRSFKKKCIECLNKHGHLWSHELQFVLDLYIKTEMCEHWNYFEFSRKKNPISWKLYLLVWLSLFSIHTIATKATNFFMMMSFHMILWK